jgi:hypothetical protein
MTHASIFAAGLNKQVAKRVPDTKNFTIARAIDSLEAANNKIVKEAGYSCGLENFPRQRGKVVTGFFSSPDYQNEKLYYTLIKDGWRNAGYGAAYYWKVRRGPVILGYSEGDITIWEEKDITN